VVTKSILLKLSPEVHEKIQAAAHLHRRSMQMLLQALIETWLLDGAADPLNDLRGTEDSSSKAVDDGARTAIAGMADHIQELQTITAELVSQIAELKRPTTPGDAWAEQVLDGIQDGHRLQSDQPGRQKPRSIQSAPFLSVDDRDKIAQSKLADAATADDRPSSFSEAEWQMIEAYRHRQAEQ